MAFDFGSLAGGLVSGIGSAIVSNAFANSNAEKQDKRTKALQQWQMTEGPRLQIQGLRNAGLSPAFTDGAVTPSASGSAPTGPSIDFGSAINAFANASLAQAQANLADKNAVIAEAEGNVLSDEQVLEWRKQLYQFENKLKGETAGLTEANKEHAQVLLKQLQEADKQHLNQFVEAVKKIKSEIDVNEKTKNNLLNEGRITKKAADIATQSGILPTDDGFKALIHLIVDGKAGKVIDALFKGLIDGGKSIISNTIGKLIP